MRDGGVKKNKYDLRLIIMIFISFVTQILSLLKSSVVAGIFGTSDSMDAYNLANSIVSFVFGFVASGISTIIIPEYANNRSKKAVDTFITVIYGTILIVVVAMIVLRTQLIGLFSNRGEMFTNITANILIVLLFSQYLSSISNITVAYFQCEGKYNIPKIISLFCQLIVIVVLIFADNINIMQYTVIIAAGVVFNFVLDSLIALKTGWSYRPLLVIDEETKALFNRFWPIIVSTGVYRLSLMIDTTISSFLDTGKLSVLSYSTQISSMVDAVLAGNLTLYLYPKITKRVNEAGYQKEFWKQTATMHMIVCLVAAGFLTVGLETITILFQRGAFTAEASKMVFIGSSIYIVGQQTGTIRDLIYRYFYAHGDTQTPGINSIIVSVLNILISLLLVKLMGFYGIIIGTVMASFISLIIIFVRFKIKFSLEEKVSAITGRYLLNLFVFALTVLLVYLTKTLFTLDSNLVSLLIFGVETVIIYVILTILFNKKTAANLKGL